MPLQKNDSKPNIFRSLKYKNKASRNLVSDSFILPHTMPAQNFSLKLISQHHLGYVFMV